MPSALVVTLSDGPHRLTAASWSAIRFMQDAGHVVGYLRRPTDHGLQLVSEYRALAAAAAQHGVDGTLTPEQVLSSIEALDLDASLVPDFAAIAAGLTALMRQAEPERDWEVATVEALMVPSRWQSYFDAVRDLFDAAFDVDSKDAEGEAASRQEETAG